MENIVIWIKTWTDDGNLAILLFLFFAAVLVTSSIRLVKYAEIMIAKTKFGGAFIGGVLIAAVTSIPEMITEIAQAANGSPGAGVADDFGSNAFSAFLICIAAVMFYKNKILNNLDKWTKITIFTSAGLAFLASIFLFIGSDVRIGVVGTYCIGIIPLSFFLFYIYSLKLQYKYGDNNEFTEDGLSEKDKFVSIKKAITLFTIYSFIIILLALCVNWSADVMVDAWGLSQGSVGGVFLAITTSLPEVVAFFAFLHKKQPIAAIAALVGSHIFNVGIQFFGDLSYANDSTYNVQAVQDVWPIALMTGIMMLLLGINASLSNKIKKQWINILIPSVGSMLYIAGWALIIVL